MGFIDKLTSCFRSERADADIGELVAARDASYRERNSGQSLSPEELAERKNAMQEKLANMKKKGRGVLPVSRFDSDVVGGRAFASGTAMGGYQV